MQLHNTNSKSILDPLLDNLDSSYTQKSPCNNEYIHIKAKGDYERRQYFLPQLSLSSFSKSFL